jgi:hypothetical protein
MSEVTTISNQERQNLIEKFLREVAPWHNISHEDSLELFTEKSPANFLGRFYLFPIEQFTISNEIEDVTRFINQRYINLLAAAHRADLTVTTTIVGHAGAVNIYVGFLAAQEKNPSVFKKIVEGIYPGVEIGPTQAVDPRFFRGKNFGGIVSGIPVIKIDDEKQCFNIAPVIRSMHGQDYTLMLIARPVSLSDLGTQFSHLLKLRDECHSLRHVTKSEEKGGGESVQEKTESYTRGFLVVNWSTTEPGKGSEKHWSATLTVEEQNGVALELEQLSENLIDRLKKGFNVGYWETTITFVCETTTARDILGGSLIGELSKPSTDGVPPKLRLSEVDKEKMLLLPIADSTSVIFPKSLCSYLTSEELSMLSSVPAESLPGYEIQRMPTLRLTDLHADSDSPRCVIGRICEYGKPLPESDFALSHNNLVKHTFVCGITGSGKTTTVKHILKNAGVPFLVLESAKRDYRRLLGDDAFRDNLRIYTIGDATICPIQINPFYVMYGVSPLSHIDYLKAIFNASFSLYGPMPHILEKCLHNIYSKKGWNLTRGTHPFFCGDDRLHEVSRYQDPDHLFCFPTLEDLKNEVNYYVKHHLDYRGELSDNIRTAIIARLESLAVGAKGLMFNTNAVCDVAKLVEYPTVFEMEALSDDDDKAFFVGLMLVLLSEFRQTNNPDLDPLAMEAVGLRHILVIEEAHRLLKNVETERTTELMGNPKGKALETFCNMIAEMRSLGQAIVVAEQIPTKIAPDVIKNTNTKISHRLVGRDDQCVIAASLNMSEDDALYLGRLRTGFALALKEGMDRPVEIMVVSNVREVKVSHDKIIRRMSQFGASQSDTLMDVHELSQVCGPAGSTIAIQWLNSVIVSPSEMGRELLKQAEMGLSSLCLQRNHPTMSDPAVIKNYLLDQLLPLFTQGTYSKGWKPPEGIRRVLDHTIANGNPESVQDFKVLLARYWGVEQVEDGLSERLCLLVKKFLNDKGLHELGDSALDKVIDDYFLVPNAVFRCQIRGRVQHDQVNEGAAKSEISDNRMDEGGS